MDGQAALEQATRILQEARRVAVLTGAGISTDSSIPDYRGPNGVWTKKPEAEKQATLQNYVADPEIRKRAWQTRTSSPIFDAQPNTGHEAMLQLEDGRLHTLVTQNVDGLHHKAGSDPSKIVEIHGSVRDVVCLSCDYRAPMSVALDRVRAGESDPACPECGGILKSSTISFGQSLVEDDLIRAQAAAEACDVMLAIGTTLAVYPIAAMVPVAKRSGAAIVIVNGTPTEMDHDADVVVRGSISEVLPVLLAPPP